MSPQTIPLSDLAVGAHALISKMGDDPASLLSALHGLLSRSACGAGPARLRRRALGLPRGRRRCRPAPGDGGPHLRQDGRLIARIPYSSDYWPSQCRQVHRIQPAHRPAPEGRQLLRRHRGAARRADQGNPHPPARPARRMEPGRRRVGDLTRRTSASRCAPCAARSKANRARGRPSHPRCHPASPPDDAGPPGDRAPSAHAGGGQYDRCSGRARGLSRPPLAGPGAQLPGRHGQRRHGQRHGCHPAICRRQDRLRQVPAAARHAAARRTAPDRLSAQHVRD